MTTELKGDGQGLIPAVAQETETGEVLMVAWMDREALAKTLTTGLAHSGSRERRALWRKGETSGHTQHVDGVFADCDRDTLLVQVHQDGVACHTGARTCFFTRLAGSASPSPPGAGPAFLEVVERVLQSRKVERPAGSYTASLFERGEAQICRKIGEEATEVVTAALGGGGGGRGGSGGAELWFHSSGPLASPRLPPRRALAELPPRPG